MDVQFTDPVSGFLIAAAQLWAWEDFRFAVSARYPERDRTDSATSAIAMLARAGFTNWKNRWLWASMPLDAALLARPDASDVILEWSRARFSDIASSGVAALAGAAPVADEGDDAVDDF